MGPALLSVGSPFGGDVVPVTRESGLNLPNVMTPGAWALLGIAGTAIIAGIVFMLWRMWSERVKWKSLEFMGVKYFAEDVGFSPDFLRQAVDKARAFLILHTRWPTAQTDKALGGFSVYVVADDMYVDAKKHTGTELDGVLRVNRKLTTLCHEMAHLLHERVGIVDYEHARWEPDGFLLAERAYDDWLANRA